MRAVYRISPDFWLRHRYPRRSVLMALRSPISLHASPDDDATGLLSTSSITSVRGRRAHHSQLSDIDSMGWSSGSDPDRQKSCLARAAPPLPARIPTPRSRDLRFVVVPDDQRPSRSPNRSVPKCPSAIDQMSRRHEDRRNEFKRRFPKSGLHHRSSVPSSMPAPRGHPRSPRPCGPKW